MLKKSSGTLTQPYHLRLKRHITHDRKHRLENPHVSTHFSPVLPLRFTRFRLQNDSCGNVRKQTTRLTRQSRESWRPADTRDHTIRRLYRKDGKLSGEREGFPQISRSRLSARSPPPPPFSAKNEHSPTSRLPVKRFLDQVHFFFFTWETHFCYACLAVLHSDGFNHLKDF